MKLKTKNLLPWLALASFCLFGAALLFQMATESPVHVIHQESKFAVIGVSDPELADAFANGEIEIKTDDPDARTLVRVTSGEPTRIHGRLKGAGKIFVINPAGIIVGSGSGFTDTGQTSFGKAVVHSTLETHTFIEGKSIAEGNVYALATEEKGYIRASRPISVRPAPEKEKK